MAVLYALVLGFIIYHTMKPRDFVLCLMNVFKSCGSVMLIIAASKCFSWVLTAENLDLDTAGIGSMLNLFSEKAMELKDGQLVSEFTMEGVEGSTGISLTLLQDGMIHMELLSNGESMFSLFFAPAEAEAAE